MMTVLPFDAMQDGLKRLTIDIPEDLHEMFVRKCFLATPRQTMKQRIIEFIAHEVGREPPKLVDRRKMNRDEREKYDRQQSKARRSR
jgi:hypothetical protein